MYDCPLLVEIILYFPLIFNRMDAVYIKFTCIKSVCGLNLTSGALPQRIESLLIISENMQMK